MAEHRHAAHGWPAGYRIRQQWEIMGAIAEASQPAWLTTELSSGEARLVRQMDLACIPEQQEQEWSSWAGLPNHPNIVRAFERVQEVSRERSVPLTVIEFVGGTNLRHWIGNPQLMARPQRVLRFALQIVEALRHARKHGLLVHGNLSPENCLIAAGEVVKLTDFGPARAWALPETEAGCASALSSPVCRKRLHYLAPERFDDPLQVDDRSDVYSMGVLLFEILSGAPPVHASEREEYRARFAEMGRPVITIEPAPLKWLLEGCLEPDPKHRIADIDGVWSLLKKCWPYFSDEPRPTRLRGPQWKAQKQVERSAGFRALGRLTEASAALETAAALAPDALSVHWQRVALLTEEERFAEALEAYDGLLKVSPEPQEVLVQKGDLFHRLEKNRSALDCYDEALRLDPYLERAWFHKAVLMEEMDREADAVSLYDHLLRLNPTHSGALSNKAGLLVAMGIPEEALPMLDRALAVEPGNGVLCFNKGALLAMVFHRFEEALVWLEKAQELGMAQAAEAIATVRDAMEEQGQAQPDEQQGGMIQ